MFVRAILVSAVCAALCCGVARAAPAGVFSDKPFDAAMAEAQQEKRLFVAKMTAPWCGFCVRMDRETWPDEELAAWIGRHAIIVAVDADNERELVESLEVRTLPTVIAFRDGKEFARLVGFHSAPQMLLFLRAAERGEIAEESDLRALRDDPGLDMQERYGRALELMQYGELDKATEELLWLWENIHQVDPSKGPMRMSFLAGNIGQLARQHPPAREAFAAVRDNDERMLQEGMGTLSNLRDWLVLCNELGDHQRILDWVDRVKDDPEGVESMRRAGHTVERLLQREGRWGDYGLLIEEPLMSIRIKFEVNEQFIQRIRQHAGDMPFGADPDEMIRRQHDSIAEKVSLYYKSLLAAGRVDEAIGVRELATERVRDGSIHEFMLRDALDSGVLHNDLSKLADRADPATRERLQRLLSERSPQ